MPAASSTDGPVGRSIPRLEDHPLLTGSAAFVDDIHLEGLVNVAFLRSPLAHARLRSPQSQPADLPLAPRESAREGPWLRRQRSSTR